jgi:hypothetical protein
MAVKVAFRFKDPDAALDMPFYRLKYWYHWILDVEKEERKMLHGH